MVICYRCTDMLQPPWRFAVLLAVLALPASSAAAQDAPTAQFDALQKEYDKASSAYMKKLEGAKGIALQGKIFREENPQPAFAERFLELAKKFPSDPIAFKSLTWVVETSEFGPTTEKPYSQAIDLLASKYADHKDVERLFERMVNSPFAASGRFLQAVFEKHPSTAVRGRAGFHWALYQKNYLATVNNLRTQADWAKNVELFVGPELVEQLKKTDAGRWTRCSSESTRTMR